MDAIVYSALEYITGLTREDFEEYSDVHLMDAGILDSLAIVSLLTKISKDSGKQITINDMVKDDFSSVTALIRAVEKF